MRVDVVNHQIWVARGAGQNRGKSKCERESLRKFARSLEKPSVDNSITFAIRGDTIVAVADEAREMMNTPATADLAPIARERVIKNAQADLPELLTGRLASFVTERAAELLEDHARLRAAAGSVSRVSVEAVHPPDVIGLFVLMPGEV